MTVIPQDAQRSEDGQWWWDGAQWKPVSAASTEPTQAATAGSAAAGSAATVTSGQLSEDGQWQWDGAQWQPHDATAGAPHAATPSVSITDLVLAPAALNDGTTGFNVRFTVTNTGSAAIDQGVLTPAVFARSEHSAESNARARGLPIEALAAGASHEESVPVQLDPGTWTVTVQVADTSGTVVGTSADATAVIAGHETAQRAFDDTHAYSMSVKITQVEHVAAALFRVHYTLENTGDHDLPAGMQVKGEIGNGQSMEWYQLQSPLGARQSHQNYLTLEAVSPSTVIAMITVDPTGPSTAADAVKVDIAEDGTPTIVP